MNQNNSSLTHSLLWHASIACFLIAVLTGFLYRVGMLGWVPGDLSLGNIRHAHSHLMFFGWAVPLPLYILMQKIMAKSEGQASGMSLMKYSIGWVLFFGAMAYPFFLFYGYRPITIAATSMPLSVIFSGLVMVGWYGFIAGYLKNRALLNEEQAQPWFDGALALLFVCSLGAWGVAIIQAVNPSNHLFMEGLTHFFLATFTEGWIVLVLAGILISELSLDKDSCPISLQIALGAIAIGAPLTFPYGISVSLLSPMLLIVARLGGLLTATGLLIIIYTFISVGKWKKHIWIWPISLLALKGLIQIMASVVPSTFWLSDHALRIFYLHILLLGAFTLSMIGWLHIRSSVSKRIFTAVVFSIIVVLISLVLPSQIWPTAWSGLWVFYALAIAATFPVVAVLVEWVKISVNTSKSSPS